MNYFLKKKLYNFADGTSRFGATTPRFNFNLQETSLGPLLFTRKNFSLAVKRWGYSRRTITMGQVEHDRCLKSLCSRGRQTTSRYQLLYIFLRGYILRKKQSHLLKLKRLLPAFKIMVLNQSVMPQQKTRAGQGVSQSLALYQTLNDYFFSPAFYFNINKGSRWLSMEEIINHFLFYSEGPCLPQGFSQGSVEAPKGHLGVSIISNGSNKPVRARIRSSILVMAGHVNSLVQGVGLGDFVVIVSASNIVVGEIDR